MIDLPITPSERAAFERALVQSHRIRVKLTLFDRDESRIGALERMIHSGSVHIDRTGESTRALSLNLIDPRRTLRFEPDSPAEGALHADNFIGVQYGVYVAELAQWVDVPVFHGPITLVERLGATARVEALGKESLMLAPHLAGQGYTIRKGTRTDDAIRRVAGQAGERRFQLADLGRRLRRSQVVGPETEPWKVIVGGEESAKGKVLPSLADRGGHDLEVFYNGTGHLTARRRDTNPSFTFAEGKHLTGEPTVKWDVREFRNAVIVRGGKRKKKARARAFVTLPASHPLSPRSLARNGEDRYLVEVFESEGLKTDAECRRRGQEILNRKSREAVTAEFESLVVPHLDEADTVVLKTAEYDLRFDFQQATIPLVPTETMSVGFLKVVR